MIYHDTTAIDAVNTNKDTPDAFYHKSSLIATSKYIPIDGWRGYSEVMVEPGYISLGADWMTGDYDDAPEGHASRAVELKQIQLERTHGNLWVIYTPTSNVFSTSYTTLVKDPDYKPTKQEKGKLIAGSTRKFDSPDGSFRVRYHATDVITYDASTSTYTLNSGGWATMTTCKRINQFLPDGYYVCRRNYELKFGAPDAELVEFVDGMAVVA